MFSYELIDEDYELPYNAPGKSSSYFDLDDHFGKGYPSHRSDGVKLQTILGNSGDFDMERVGGPTGWGAEALDHGIKSFQKRNGLEVDGWVRPGGPTITKMKEQYGGLLSDFEAPTPKQADTNLRLRDAGHSGFLKSKRQELLLPPIPGLPKPDDNILGANHSLVRTVRDSGLRDTPDWMAKSVRRDQKEGVVEARDFVNQLEQLIPGEGTKAVRGILQALADTPQLQQAFFGGPVVDLAPIGVFEPDGPARYEEAIQTRPWEEYEQGRKPPAKEITREWDEARDGPAPEAQVRPITEADAGKHKVQLRDASVEAEAPAYNDGLLDPTSWPEHLRGQSEEVARATALQTSRAEEIDGQVTASDKEDEDASAIQIAQAQGQRPQQPSAGREPRQVPPPNPIPPREPFRALLAERETQGQLGLTNTTKGNDRKPQEVLGMYQLSRDILVDAGLKNRDGSWREGNAAGVSSDAAFLESREAQDKALGLVLGVYSRQVQAAGADRVIGQQIAGIRAQITVTESGLIAAAHRGGIGNLQTYIKRMEANGWDSQRAVANIERESNNPDTRKELEDWHRRIETRLREFGPVNLR